MMKFANFAVFQIGWLACVYGGANQQPWLGTLFVAAAVLLHLQMARKPLLEVRLLVTAGAIGLVWELALVNSSLVIYPSGILVAGTPPHWILALWVLFAMTLNSSMRWLRDRFFLSLCLGAVAGPLSYLAGHKLGAVTFPDTALAMMVLAAGWAVITPSLMLLASRLDGMSDKVVPQLTSEYLEEAA